MKWNGVGFDLRIRKRFWDWGFQFCCREICFGFGGGNEKKKI